MSDLPSKPETVTLSCETFAGKVTEVEFKLTLNARDFKGTAILPWLLMAANPSLTWGTISFLFWHEGVKRTRSWYYRRRWMMSPTDVLTKRASADGKDEQARSIIRDNPNISARELSRFLAKRGIKRGKSWVQMNRCV